jgi:hypothetical protein
LFVNGYLTSLYAESLAEFGTPYSLPQSGGWLLLRAIPGSAEHDAIGCYRLFNCRNWPCLGSDLDGLAAKAVAVSMVVDPFSSADETLCRAWFPDACRPFKEHAVVSFVRSWREEISRHHRRNVRVAARRVDVERCENPCAWLETWVELYRQLIDRHHLRGIARFSPASFSRQLRVPGIAAFRATVGTETVGMVLWYVAGTVAYYHLGAFNPLGYASRAAYALFDVALNDLAKQGVYWAELGAGAGWRAEAPDGLVRFKNGWANERRTAWFYGRVLARDKYERLTTARKFPADEYFPSYRHPEAA